MTLTTKRLNVLFVCFSNLNQTYLNLYASSISGKKEKEYKITRREIKIGVLVNEEVVEEGGGDGAWAGIGDLGEIWEKEK